MRNKPARAVPMSRARREALEARTYVLRIVPERAPMVSRTIEVRATQTLADLHVAIQDAFDLDDDHLYAFYMSGRAFDRDTAYQGPGKNALRVTLQAAGVKPGRRFLYLFDFGDELRHEITVEAEGERQPDATYPRVLAAEGSAPPQYRGDAPLDEDLHALAEEVAAAARAHAERFAEHDCEAAVHDDAAHDHEAAVPELDPESLRAQVDLADRLLAALQGRPWQLDAICETHETDVVEWLSDLCFTLARQGHVRAALVMHAAWDKLFAEDAFLGDRAFLLAAGGRPDEAVAEGERMVAKLPDNMEAIERLAGILHRVGRLADAEVHYRRVMAESLEPEQRLIAGENLAEILRLLGRGEEADALDKTLEALPESDEDLEDWEDEEDLEEGEEAEEAGEEPPAEDVAIHQAPPAVQKVGRNEPCPCGSGVKYKRCCGR